MTRPRKRDLVHNLDMATMAYQTQLQQWGEDNLATQSAWGRMIDAREELARWFPK